MPQQLRLFGKFDNASLVCFFSADGSIVDPLVAVYSKISSSSPVHALRKYGVPVVAKVRLSVESAPSL